MSLWFIFTVDSWRSVRVRSPQLTLWPSCRQPIGWSALVLMLWDPQQLQSHTDHGETGKPSSARSDWTTDAAGTERERACESEIHRRAFSHCVQALLQKKTWGQMKEQNHRERESVWVWDPQTSLQSLCASSTSEENMRTNEGTKPQRERERVSLRSTDEPSVTVCKLYFRRKHEDKWRNKTTGTLWSHICTPVAI